MAFLTHYEIQVRVLSPVHIGDSSELLRDLDYVARNEKTWVVDQDAVVERKVGEEFDDRLIGRPISELLDEDDFEDRSLFRYQMSGMPINRSLKAHSKDVEGHPYLPGSTLKGLLRTLLIWGVYRDSRQAPDLKALGRGRSWAGQPIERQVMGGSPTDDIFRAVRIGDSLPVPLDRLRVAAASIFPTATNETQGVIVDLEVLRETTTFIARMTIDEHLFTNAAAQARLHWGDKRTWIDRLARYGKLFSRQRLIEEVEYFQRYKLRSLLGFYDQLADQWQQAGENEFIAQIGWGSGWNSKTLNDQLRGDANEFFHLVRQYKLTRFADEFEPGMPFPGSRHLVLRGGRPVQPLGWVMVSIVEIDDGRQG